MSKKLSTRINTLNISVIFNIIISFSISFCFYLTYSRSVLISSWIDHNCQLYRASDSDHTHHYSFVGSFVVLSNSLEMINSARTVDPRKREIITCVRALRVAIWPVFSGFSFGSNRRSQVKMRIGRPSVFTCITFFTCARLFHRHREVDTQVNHTLCTGVCEKLRVKCPDNSIYSCFPIFHPIRVNTSTSAPMTAKPYK